ncbi:MAG: GNAT family N-acetyltransferase, partial [Chitinophagaceae bacterium]
MSDASVTIRVATAEDAALIAEMSQRTFYDTFAAANTTANMDKFLSEQFSIAMLVAEVSEPGNLFLLAECEGRPAGYARLREDNNPPELAGLPTLEIARIYAVKEMIGQGVGKALMQAAIDIARSGSKQVIWLGVWEKNETAIAFYTRWGFEKFGEHPFILGDDVQTDWLLKREV